MARAYPPSPLWNGQLVGFNVKRRGNAPTYFAYFRSPDGRRLERDTNQTGMIRAVAAARAIIEQEYAPAPLAADKISWDDAVGRLKGRLATAGTRESTLGYYLKLMRRVREMYGPTFGPVDISPGMAAAWRDRM